MIKIPFLPKTREDTVFINGTASLTSRKRGGVVGAGLENPDPLFPVRDFLNRNTWLLWPRAVSAAGPANLPSLFLRVMRKTPAYLHRRAGVWILSRRGLWGY